MVISIAGLYFVEPCSWTKLRNNIGEDDFDNLTFTIVCLVSDLGAKSCFQLKMVLKLIHFNFEFKCDLLRSIFSHSFQKHYHLGLLLFFSVSELEEIEILVTYTSRIKAEILIETIVVWLTLWQTNLTTIKLLKENRLGWGVIVEGLLKPDP